MNSYLRLLLIAFFLFLSATTFSQVIDGGAMVKDLVKEGGKELSKRARLKPRKNTRFNRNYHNLTAKYNAYWNGRYKLRTAEKLMETTIALDYTEILPTFIIPSKKDASSFFPQMNTAIKKGTKVIKKHSIFSKGKEYCKWIDDSYLLIGKSHFYKHEFIKAEEFLSYIKKSFKKEPTFYEASIILSKIYISKKDDESAKEVLEKIKKKKVPKKLASDFFATKAGYFILVEDYKEAINQLKHAVVQKKVKRYDKSRYHYIIAQLYEALSDIKTAKNYYVLAEKSNNYELKFNAKINATTSEAKISKSGTEFLKKKLLKMLKDKKNSDYKDRIYYAIGAVYESEGDYQEAIVYYQKSVDNAKKGTHKGLTHYKLAEINYSLHNYLAASENYKYTIENLSPKHRFFARAKRMTVTLRILVKNLTIVNTQDSILKLANNKSYRRKMIKKRIQQIIAERAEKNNNDQEEELPTSNIRNSNSEGWYFYNPTTVSIGVKRFKGKWGNLTLKDNWRRSQEKESTGFGTNQKDSVAKDVVDSLLIPEYYEKRLPNSPEEKALANHKIIKSLYILGNLYKRSFDDFKNAKKAFHRILNEYDSTKLKVDVLFKLYNIASLENDKENEKKYKTIILNDYPYSDYSKLIQDPNYNNIKISNKKIIENYYARIFAIYKKKDYNRVIFRAEKSKSLYPDNEMQDYFDYILILARAQKKMNIAPLLKKFIIHYPDSKLNKEAKKLQQLLNKKEKKKKENSGESLFSKITNKPYYYLVVIDSLNDPKIQIKLDEFNETFFSTSQLKTSTIILNKKQSAIIIKSYLSLEQAIVYHKAFNKQSPVTAASLLNNFVITQENFLVLYQKKKINAYQNFFNKNYPLN